MVTLILTLTLHCLTLDFLEVNHCDFWQVNLHHSVQVMLTYFLIRGCQEEFPIHHSWDYLGVSLTHS